MNFWKPGEEHPDGLEEENVEMVGSIPSNRMAREYQKEKTELSENLKNMPFMVRSNAEKVRQKEEIAALKELQSYMWSYRTVKATEGLDVSTHPLSGPIVNTLEEEECKRFSFGGFNKRVDDIMKERKEHRKMKSGVLSATTNGNVNVKETLRKFNYHKEVTNRYSTFRDNRKN